MHIPVEGQDPYATPNHAYYVVLLTKGSAAGATDWEREVIASWAEYWLRRLYEPWFVERLLAMPDGPADRGHNTVILSLRTKNPSPALWGYYKVTWTTPWPVPDEGLPIVRLLDRIQQQGTLDGVPVRDPNWEAWKSDRSELFEREDVAR